MLGLISAMATEIDLIAKNMTDVSEEKISCIRILKGKLKGREIVAATGAYGKVSAAMAAMLLIDRYKADRIINIGVAGGLDKDMRQCDFAVASAFVQHDVDSSPIGDPLGLISGLYTIDFKTDSGVTDALVSAAKKHGDGSVFIGTFATGDQFVASKERADFIRSQFGAIACEMEGGAAAQVCSMMEVPYGALRCISDNADGEAGMSYDEFRDKTAALCAKIVIAAAEEL